MRVANIIFWHNIITDEKIFSKEDIELLKEVDQDLKYSPGITLKKMFFDDLRGELDIEDDCFELLKEKINLFAKIWLAREEGKEYKPNRNYKDEDNEIKVKTYEYDPVLADFETKIHRGYENTYWGL